MEKCQCIPEDTISTGPLTNMNETGLKTKLGSWACRNVSEMVPWSVADEQYPDAHCLLEVQGISVPVGWLILAQMPRTKTTPSSNTMKQIKKTTDKLTYHHINTGWLSFPSNTCHVLYVTSHLCCHSGYQTLHKDNMYTAILICMQSCPHPHPPHTPTHLHTHACHVRMCVCVFACVCMHLCVCVRMCACMYATYTCV